MTYLSPRARILCAMEFHGTRRTRRAPRAFTLIEVVVALVLTSAGAAALAGTVTADRRLRDMAAAQVFAADRARDLMELLSALPCASDANGTFTSTWGSERWHAAPSRSTWSVTDSILLRRVAAPLIVASRVTCPD